MELAYRHIERDARFATEITRALWGGEEEKPNRGGVNIDERLEALHDDLAWYSKCMTESDGDSRNLYAKRVTETQSAII